MWLTKQTTQKETEDPIRIGKVTIEGERPGVYTDYEQRDASIVSPGGYIWRPKYGDDVLIIKCGNNELFTAGIQSTEENTISAGEVMIKSADGGYIYLKNDGSILINGQVSIDGGLTVNGNEIS